MRKEELFKYVDTEVQGLRYYALKTTRDLLDINLSIYDTLKSIGYTKRVLELDRRCGHSRVTSNEPLTKDTPIESVEFIGSPRNHSQNIYTGLEFWIMKYPEHNQAILDYLQERVNYFKID